jgi:hypothetical protein
MAAGFDTFLFADYSGAADPSAQKRAMALWRLDRGGRARKVRGPFTRDSLREAIFDALAEATAWGRRVLFGIDHQWSWPRDLWRAAGLEGWPWREALGRLVEGDGRWPPLGPPDRFAAAFNAFAGAGIFHCRVKGLAARYGLPTRSDWKGDPVRLTERAMPGAKPATRLGGVGAVAGQTLVGLGQLHRLLSDAAAAGIPLLAWPFDGLADDGRSHVGVEIYPSFYRPSHVSKSHDADARACCMWASSADLRRLLDLRRAPRAVRETARIEGWILGAAALDSSPSPSERSGGDGEERARGGVRPRHERGSDERDRLPARHPSAQGPLPLPLDRRGVGRGHRRRRHRRRRVRA